MARGASGVKTDVGHQAAEVVGNANDLARRFYRRMGCERPKGFRFDKATHPQEQMCWEMACDAADHFFGTDIESALDDLDD